MQVWTRIPEKKAVSTKPDWLKLQWPWRGWNGAGLKA